MKAGHSDIVDVADGVAHNFGGNRRFLSNREIAGPRAHNRDRSGAFGRRLGFDRHATGHLVIGGRFELLPDGFGLHRRHPGDQQAFSFSQIFRAMLTIWSAVLPAP